MEMVADPNYSASVVTHAFKGLKLGAMPPPLGSPLIGSPRPSRIISNSGSKVCHVFARNQYFYDCFYLS